MTAVRVRPVRSTTSEMASDRNHASSLAVQRRSASGPLSHCRLWDSLVLRHVAVKCLVPGLAAAIFCTTSAGRFLSRLAAAIFSQRSGSSAFLHASR